MRITLNMEQINARLEAAMPDGAVQAGSSGLLPPRLPPSAGILAD
jgi:hypothetical protein